ncbi:MAG: DHH family phosphoesterase [Firmicutes bacterium]|nr:DHH family phosphoesterase [Bacillota bacterium]
MNDLTKIAQAIKKRDDFLLVGHSIPDGDCIGSLLGMYLGLVSLGKKVKVLLQEPVPVIYRYLAGSEVVVRPEQLVQSIRNVIFLDCSDVERTGDKVAGLFNGSQFAINIDHHHSNTCFGQLNYVDAHAASTAELVFQVLRKLQVNIDTDIAKALYVGLLQDTGGFQHSSTTGDTLRTAAELLDKGVDLDQVKLNLFESKSRAEVMLLSLALKNINFSSSGRIAWMILNHDDVAAVGALDICPEGIINYALTIKGVEVGLMFREISPGLIKVGFRSKGTVDVAALAAEFGGGGHHRAAGAKHDGNMEEAEREVILAVESVVG